MEYQRDRVKQHFETLLNGREKMTAAEGKEYLKLIVFSQNSIYQYLTVEDMEKLRRASSPECVTPDDADYDQREAQILHGLLDHMEGVRQDVDQPISSKSWLWLRSTGSPCTPTPWTARWSGSTNCCFL